MPWSKESDESCILELSRRSSAACQWRPTTFRRAIVSEEPFVGSKLQCFHNRMTGFADWAQLFRNEGTGAWYAVLHTQRGTDVPRRTFSKRQVLRLGELLDRYDEVRVNNHEHGASEGIDASFFGGGGGDESPRSRNWTSADVGSCVNEVRRRLGENVEPGVLIIASGETLTLECGGDYNGAPWVARFANGSTCSLGELLDVYPRLELGSPPQQHRKKKLSGLEDDSDSFGTTSFDDETPPPPAAENDDRVAFDLFVPVVAKSRRERAALDDEAIASAEKVAREAASDVVLEDTFAAVTAKGSVVVRKTTKPSALAKVLEREAAAASLRAPRSYFTGISLRRPADALYDAVLEQRSRQRFHTSPAVAVAFAIARAALADHSTAPGAAMDVVAGNFFASIVDDIDSHLQFSNHQQQHGGFLPPGVDQPDVVAMALESSRVCLRALYKYHPALFCTTRDVAVAALEACDQAILGDDVDVRPAARELRYAAVLRALVDNDGVAAAHHEPDPTLESSSSSSDDSSTVPSSPRKSVRVLLTLRCRRTARGKLRIMVETLEAIAAELSAENSKRIASDDLMPALCDVIRDSQFPLTELNAHLRFAKIFNRDPKLLLGADGYALTSFEIAIAAINQSSPRNEIDDVDTPNELLAGGGVHHNSSSVTTMTTNNNNGHTSSSTVPASTLDDDNTTTDPASFAIKTFPPSAAVSRHPPQWRPPTPPRSRPRASSSVSASVPSSYHGDDTDFSDTDTTLANQ